MVSFPSAAVGSVFHEVQTLLPRQIILAAPYRILISSIMASLYLMERLPRKLTFTLVEAMQAIVHSRSSP
jgi:hypothetical protein